jgi:hypothetical protein
MICRGFVCAVALAWVPVVVASEPASFACTVDGVVKHETGLGSEVDDIVHIPSRLRSNTRSAQLDGWTFEYGAGAFTYRDTKRITIRRGASALNMVAQFSHEVGHAGYSYRPDFSSRDAYIRRACTDEGHGLVENIIAHRAMDTCASEHLGVVSAEPEWFLAKYEEMAQRPPVNIPTIGYMFCERNRVPTGETYLDYYGNWYDANHGVMTVAAAADVEPDLWRQIETFADAGRLGGAVLRTTWPFSSPVKDIASSVVPNGTTTGGVAQLSASVFVSGSEVRADVDDKVAVASMALEGRCVTRPEIVRHYPSLAISQPPSPHGPQRTVWSATGEWGELMFAFEEGAPDCVGTISLSPHPKHEEQ